MRHTNSSRLQFLGLISASIAALPAIVVAGPPLPGESVVPACIAVCPAGDIVFEVTGVRNGGPVEGWPINIDFCACPDVHFAPLDGPAPYWFTVGNCQVATLTLTAGVAAFPLRAGGVCRDAQLAVTDPLVLGTLQGVASPDQNGDLVVDATDVAIADAKLGAHDATMDLDCDGTVTSADLAILQAHLGHRQGPSTRVQGSPWGRVKSQYR